MKILYIKLTDGYTDSFTYQENILPRKFVLLGHDTHLVVSPRSRDTSGTRIYRAQQTYKDKYGVVIHVLPFSRRFKWLTSKFDYYDKLEILLNEIKPDFIFFHGVQCASLLIVAKYKKFHPKTKLVVDNHGDYIIMPLNNIKRFLTHKLLYRFFIKHSENYIDTFYAVSPSRADYLSEVYGIARQKIKVITQGGDEALVDKFLHKDARKEIIDANKIQEKTILLVTGAGCIDEKKNLEPLLKVVANNKIFSLVIFGSFTKSEKEKCNDYLKCNNIFYIGRLHGDELYYYLIAADLVIFPGQHSVLWDQTVACGTPLCIRRWHGLDYFDINGNCVYLEQGTDCDIQHLLTSLACDNKIHEMYIAAQGRSKQEFSYLTIAKRILK